MPEPQPPPGPDLGQTANAFAWLTGTFGKTDAILIAGLLGALGMWLGFIPNPIMNRIMHVETEVSRICVKVMCDPTKPDFDACSEKCWTGQSK